MDTTGRINQIELSFLDVNVSVDVKNTKTKQLETKVILDNLSGVIHNSEFTAIMGPSGSGKTTLLNFLSGRMESQTLKTSGSILLNRQAITDMEEYNHQVAYVQQDDVLYTMFTPREAIQFAAKMRLKGTEQEKLEKVESVIRELGLEKCADTRVGNAVVRGISGGERKRTSIGVELITNPSLIFLDEPTTGLDSETALRVIQLLKKLADTGRTVITTIHQPSSQIFVSFDKLMLICQGSLIYHGSASGSINYFRDLGYPCSENSNPADYYMRIMDADDIRLSYEEKNIDITDQEVDEKFTQKLQLLRGKYTVNQLRPQLQDIRSQSVNPNLTSIEKLKSSRDYSASWITQFILLLIRTISNELRNPTELKLKTIQVIFGAIINIVVFHNLNSECNKGIQNRDGLLFFLITGIGFASVNGTLGTFSFERPIFLRERLNKSYSVGPYFWSKSLGELPLYILWPLLQSKIVYFVCGLNDNQFIEKFLIFYLTLFGVYFAGSAYGLFLSSVISKIEVAAALTPVLLIPLMSFGGFFVNSKNLAFYLKPFEYLSFWKYSYQALEINEYTDLKAEKLNCSMIPHPIDPLKEKDFNEGLWLNIFALIALGLFWRTMSYISMYYISKPKQPNLVIPQLVDKEQQLSSIQD